MQTEIHTSTEPRVSPTDLYYPEGKMVELLSQGDGVSLEEIPAEYAALFCLWMPQNPVPERLTAQEFRAFYGWLAMRDNFTTVAQEEAALQLRAQAANQEGGVLC